MDGPWGYYAKWDKPDKDKHTVWYFLYIASQKTNLKKQNGMVTTRDWGAGGWERLFFKGTDVQPVDK